MSSAGIKLERFPEEFRVFARNGLSLSLERYGGVNGIDRIDVLEYGGKRYPDRVATPILSKNCSLHNRPLYGPGLSFHIEDADGKVSLASLRNLELFPSGVASREYSMLLLDDAVFFTFQLKKNAQKFIVSLDLTHLPTPTLASLKNQYADKTLSWGVRTFPKRFLDPDFNPDLPFTDAPASVTRTPVVFDAAQNALTQTMHIAYCQGHQDLSFAMTGNLSFQLHETPGQKHLECDVSSEKTIHFVISLAPSSASAISYARDLLADSASYWPRYRRELRKIERKRPHVFMETLPEADCFLKLAAPSLEALLIARNPKRRETCIRAAAHKYGFFILWDHIYPIRSFLYLNDLENARRLLRYTFDYPLMHTMVFGAAQVVLALDEYLAYVPGDRAILAEAWPFIRRFMEFSGRMSNPETGFVLARISAGVDVPSEIGLSEFFYPVCINGWYYGACRCVEALALEHGETEFADEMAARAAKIQTSYEKYFFNSEDGYLYAGIDDDLLPRCKNYQNSNTLSLDYPHGEALLFRTLPRLAEFQINKLFHPMGMSAVPFDSAVPCEMWRHVHMNQHLSHECKLRRDANRVDDAWRIMVACLKEFTACANAVETFNLGGCTGNETQRADFQAFAATGAQSALFEGLSPIRIHRGGLQLVPCEDFRKIEIENFAGYDIYVSGRGRFFAPVEADGKILRGTLQIPVDLGFPNDEKHHVLKIRRSAKPFNRPTLLGFTGIAIETVSSTPDSLSFAASKPGHGALRFYSPSPCRLFVADKEIEITSEPEPGFFRADVRILAHQAVFITQKYSNYERSTTILRSTG